ncbi:ABC transporter substrate-binding protein [Paenibacillus eucommiae]|uniref:Peptide/nickel transport system substrate-binding protein n=1 Tax=Paenibacillus eucommiae TaxID=1355755 RepID=A0ABS4IR41_9BACL|nr:ABC transporter substrate-binding protein [Paenibacillus eucommiae]MBP1990005.1 peptide/nickel transport system substrate-binding protein [Paenibacillus eucommiae]
MVNNKQLVIAQGTDASTMDPYAHSETTTAIILLQVYDALVRRNPSMDIEPWLAESWEIITDTVVEFRLRSGITFHNGEVFDAKTVKFSLERMVDPSREPKFPPYGRFNSIDHVDIIDDLTVRVVTNRPDPNLLAQLTGLMIIPPQYIAEHGEEHFSRVPNGTGPFKFVSWDKPNGVVELTANNEYWHGSPSVQELTFKAVPEGNDRVQGLHDGTIHLAANFPPLMRAQVEADPALSVVGTPSVGVIYMGINTHHPVLKNKKLRQAMSHAINVRELIQEELSGCGAPLAGPVYPQAFGVDPGIQPITFDLEKAKQLLIEAGYPDGVDVKLEVPDGRFTQDKEIGLRIGQQLAKVGIRLQVDIQPWPQFISRFRNHQYDQMYYVGWGNSTFDPDEVYRNAYIAPNPWNPTDFHHEDMANMVMEASNILDQERRKDLYRMACLIFRDELPWIPLFQQFDLYGLSKKWDWKPRMDEYIYVCDITAVE